MKKVFALCTLLFAMQFALFAQDNPQDVQNAQEQTGNTAVTSSENQNTQALPAQNWNWNSGGYDQNQNQPSSVALFFKMVFALLIVLGLAYLAMRILKRTNKLSNSDDPFLRHVSHLSLASNRSVDVVTILDHAYILGVSDNNVNLVGEINDKELVDSMNLYADKNDNTKRPRSFSDILSIFMPNSNPNLKNQNIYGSSSFNASEMLRRQRERLNENQEGEE